MIDTRPMKVVRGDDQRGPIVSSVIVLGALAVLTFTVVGNHAITTVAPITALVVTAAVAYRTLLAWRALIAFVLLIIMFIPIRRYTLPGSLPFHLEPYRLLVAFLAVGWFTSLLIDRRVRMRGTGLGPAIALYVFVISLSLVANGHRVSTVASEVDKKLVFFASFFVFLYITASVVRRARDIDFLVSLLVFSGGILGLLAIIEGRTGYNVFNHLAGNVPFIRFDPAQIPNTPARGRLRVYASSQHAIALGALFIMLLPLAIHCVRTKRKWYWWLMPFALLGGAFSTGSRTVVIMLGVEFLVFLLLRRRETTALWPLFIPALLFVHVATPGAIGNLRNTFFPKEGLIAQQKLSGSGHGRIATLGPALSGEFKDPLVGEGFGTRVVRPVGAIQQNGPILDDQWLGILLETGVLGTIALAWIFLRFIRRAGREGKYDPSDRGWLLVSMTASVAAFAMSMFFYDTFSFTQITFMLFVFLGLGVSTLRTQPEEWARDESPEPVRARVAPSPA